MISTGAGSGDGSWYNNVHKTFFDCADAFGFEEECARIILTEHKSKSKRHLEKGEVLVINSYNDHHGIVSASCHRKDTVTFPFGAQAKVWISDVKLPVVKVS